MPSIFKPNLRLHCVEQIDVALLEQLRIKSLLLDVDCTLKAYQSTVLPKVVVEWIDTLRGAQIGLCLVSNGRGPRIQSVAERIGLPYVATAMKPFPRGCREAVAKMGFDRRTTAMVGDQIFADIIAGRLAGLFTILVDPIHPEQEPWYTRLKRPFEKILVQHIAHEPALSPKPST